MDHILFGCRNIGCTEVWVLIKALWRMKGGNWPNPGRASDVLAAVMADLRTVSGKRRVGASRLYKILITEVSFLIWKLRNKRVLGKINTETGQHTPAEVRNRWLSAINTRL